MNMKLFYFAHPYSGNPEENFRLANERTLKLLNAGYNIFSPITYSHPLHVIEPHDYDFWMRLDRAIIPRCDGIILAPGWQGSKGCQLEADYFYKHGLPILAYSKISSLRLYLNVYVGIESDTSLGHVRTAFVQNTMPKGNVIWSQKK